MRLGPHSSPNDDHDHTFHTRNEDEKEKVEKGNTKKEKKEKNHSSDAIWWRCAIPAAPIYFLSLPFPLSSAYRYTNTLTEDKHKDRTDTLTLSSSLFSTFSYFLLKPYKASGL